MSETRTPSEGTVEAVRELQSAMRELNETRTAFEEVPSDAMNIVQLCTAYQAARRRVGKAFQKVKAAEAWEERRSRKAATTVPEAPEKT